MGVKTRLNEQRRDNKWKWMVFEGGISCILMPNALIYNHALALEMKEC